MKIGDLAKKANVSVDTLRYYEKMGLLTGVKRSDGGYRQYTASNVEQVRFIRNAQHSNFSLEEISLLLSFRDAPTDEKSKIRALAGAKVQVLSERIDDLVSLRNELQLLVKKCADSGDAHCPIIDSFSDNIKE